MGAAVWRPRLACVHADGVAQTVRHLSAVCPAPAAHCAQPLTPAPAFQGSQDRHVMFHNACSTVHTAVCAQAQIHAPVRQGGSMRTARRQFAHRHVATAATAQPPVSAPAPRSGLAMTAANQCAPLPASTGIALPLTRVGVSPVGLALTAPSPCARRASFGGIPRPPSLTPPCARCRGHATFSVTSPPGATAQTSLTAANASAAGAPRKSV